MVGALGGAVSALVSWNVRGMNHPAKRSKVFSHLNKLKSEIVYLQETKLVNKDHSKLIRGGFTQVYHSDFNAKGRGVAILLHRDVQFEMSHVIKDKHGRYVIVQGKLFNRAVVMANIYAPNWDNVEFFNKIFSILPDLDSHELILAGDLNCILHKSLDRSSTKAFTLNKSARCINAFLEAYGIIDPWRYKHPETKQFSFFSPVHQSYTRIDYFLIDQKLLPMIKHVEYSSIVISDHSPVILKLCFPDNVHPQRTWRLNSRLLADKAFVDYINDQLDTFLETNLTPDISYSLVWETLKAYIRGQAISFSASSNKVRNKRAEELMERIKVVDQLHSTSPSSELYKERIVLQTEFDSISNSKAADLHLKSRHEFYEHGERAGKLLCHQLKQSATAGFISAIKDGQGNVVINQRDINARFESFYRDLYTSEACSDDLIETYFENLQLPSLEESDKRDTEKPIDMLEIENAIKKMKSGKAPGPDGFPIEFYKKFAPKLIPVLLKMFEEVLDSKTLPPTMTQASISLLLKKNKDPLLCESYRPVSLLCCDYKILTKILAGRLERIMPKLIHPDQSGFIVGRQLAGNLRRVFNVMYQPSDIEPEVLITMDAHKAFDRIQYNYLFTALEKFGFGPIFCSWIKIMYSSPQASVRTNKIMSGYFPLFRGTRQGCPLSPQLFDLAMEPFAVRLRDAEGLVGIRRGGLMNKVSLYADDLLLFLTNPTVTIPIALDLILKFGQVSGYKLNLTKSVLFPINDKARQLSYQNFPFAVSVDSFTYLGVCVTQKYRDLFDKNFKTALRKAKQDMERWATLPLSLAGRINSVKMTVMPRFLFLFQAVPIFIPKSFFKELNKHTSIFIWNNKVPRIRREFLERHKEEGGLALPNYLHYYWAANIHMLMFWVFNVPEMEAPSWLSMEQHASGSVSLSSLVCAQLPLSKRQRTNNPIIQGSLRVWSQFRTHFKLKNALVSSPVRANCNFAPSLIDPSFQRWHERGIRCVKDLFRDGNFITFEQMRRVFNVPQADFFKYLQVRSFIRKYYTLTTPPSTWVDDCLGWDPTTKGVISRLYEVIQRIASPSLDRVKGSWEEELGIELSDLEWQQAVSLVHSSSICIRHGLVQFKVLHRLHLSPGRLAAIYPDSEQSCARCGQGSATLSHMFWSCPSLTTYWTKIFDTFSNICNSTIDPNPVTALFGVLPEGVQVPAHQTEAVAFSSLLARRLILFNWKKATPPSHKQWVEDVMSHLKLEKLKYTIRGSIQKFKKVWRPFQNYFIITFSP